MTARFEIAHISPNGSTKKVAEVIADQLFAGNAAATVLDLAEVDVRDVRFESTRDDGTGCLFIGSPVYNDVAVPPVMAMIDALAPANGAWAAPFVTYGRACSGVALWQMATALQEKGYRIAGAAKIVAVHSLMWQSEHPEGEGHPDADDLEQVRFWAAGLASRIGAGTLRALPLERLDYHPPDLAAELKAKIGRPWMNIPRTVDSDACTECGDCAEVCPVGAVTLSPLPEFGERCFDCFNCIRLCPENALTPAVPIATIESFIRQRVTTIDEQPVTEFFLAEQ